MGIELPAELAEVAARTGVSWPQADEDAMRAQAAAWRAAATDVGALAVDADAVAGGALDVMRGEAGDAARALWARYVDADHGSIIAAARGAGQAADRLDHAAAQVATAKVEMVRQLVNAAKHSDAARAAAGGGHPTALLGLDTLLSGTATNLASVTDSLIGAVGNTGQAVGVQELVNAHAGGRSGHGQAGLLSAVTGLGAELVATAADSAAAPADPAPVEPDQEAVRELPSAVAEEPVGVVEQVGRGAPAAEVSSDAPTPPSGWATGGHPGSFAEAPTPRAGTPVLPGGAPSAYPGTSAPPMDASSAAAGRTSLAGFSDVPPAPAGPLAAPPGSPPVPGPVPPVGHAPAPVAHSYGPFAGGPTPAAQPGAGPHAPAPVTGQPPGPVPHRPEPPARQLPPPHPHHLAVGTPRQDRQTVVALFLVHMFPIGHLPIASGKPARQLPAPPPDTDFAAGLRFPPHDHPESHLIDADPAQRWRPRTGGSGLPADHPVVVALTEAYDPLADLHERDWDRRYLVKADAAAPEFAWPPGEMFPEGGYADGEPVVLDAGAMIDRFGDDRGRVFAEDATPFRKRALPPDQLRAGYHRYRVRRPLPMWRAVSAAWFGQPGGGVRYRAVYPAAELVSMGYLADITEERE